MSIIKTKIPMDLTGMLFDQSDWPIVHSSMKPNNILEFYGTDNEVDFNENLKTLSPSWVYRSKPISYKFNNIGLRMDKEISDVNDEYIITFGCSHSVGVGVSNEDIWPYIVANKLGIDYINSAVSGSSIKLNTINFFNMLNHLGKIPKAAIFSWPSSVRYCFYSNDQFLFYLPRFITDDKMFKYQTESYKNLLMTDFNYTESIFYRNMVKTTCLKLGIQYIEFGFDNMDDFSIKQNIKIINPSLNSMSFDNYYARDVRKYTDNTYFSHVGSGLHLLAAEYILEKIKLC